MKYYYIDGSVDSKWFDLLNEKDATFFIFYNSSSSTFSFTNALKLINAKDHCNFIKCDDGKDKISFIIASELGFNLNVDNEDEIFIVSDKNEFKVISKFWKDKKGKDIKLISYAADQTLSQKEKSEQEPSENINTTSTNTTNTQNLKKETKRKELDTIINCFGKSANNIYLALIRIFGEKEGKQTYKEVKTQKFQANHQKLDKATKIEKILKLICVHNNKENINIPEDLKCFINEHIENNNAKMQTKLIAKYEEENGKKLHKLLKSFYCILSLLK